MIEILEKAVLTALGAASLTQKKAEEMVEELKARYKMSEEEGRAFMERIQEMARAGKERSTDFAETEVKRVLDRIGVITREEFDLLKRRVDGLEARQRPVDDEPGPEC
ncbi:phasin family protein [Geomesophilobacter sediminis]|uniref:Phasin family protein n=1 Tax=Geomesophilobacter sediminis TaxID=2798584 RepID=A0A8J7JMJ1_9BACT|nr:phasin family protein [Geomesophilobacter sediminis]MBJ6725885.1 phasin family protein [Geomesophilobacter sediminis]